MAPHNRFHWILPLAAMAGACTPTPKPRPAAIVEVPPPPKSEAWKQIATPADEDRIQRIGLAWASALADAKKSNEREVREEGNLNAIKEGLGVPAGKGSCHTAEIGGYVVEGHVPASDIRRLLVEKPDARGLVLPGMPMGSPGMEMPDGRVQPYTVELVHRDGSIVAYSAHGR